jgi:hypothetical protein
VVADDLPRLGVEFPCDRSVTVHGELTVREAAEGKGGSVGGGLTEGTDPGDSHVYLPLAKASRMKGKNRRKGNSRGATVEFPCHISVFRASIPGRTLALHRKMFSCLDLAEFHAGDVSMTAGTKGISALGVEDRTSTAAFVTTDSWDMDACFEWRNASNRRHLTPNYRTTITMTGALPHQICYPKWVVAS